MSCRPLLLRNLHKVDWVRYWAISLFGMETAYFELADATLQVSDIWLHYVNLIDLLELHAQDIWTDREESSDLLAAYRYLAAAKKHLMYQGFVHCAQRYGLPVAVNGMRRGRDLVNELCSIIG
jgi:hypothetical protein